MSLFGWRERRRIADLEARDEVRLARIAELEELLAAPDDEYSLRRRAEIAGRVIDLERRLREKGDALQLALRRLDDAMGLGTVEEKALEDAGARERARRGGGV
jgi:hypothetical protein